MYRLYYFVKGRSNSTLCTTCSKIKMRPLSERHTSNPGEWLPTFRDRISTPVEGPSSPSFAEKEISCQSRNLDYHVPSYSA